MLALENLYNSSLLQISPWFGYNILLWCFAPWFSFLVFYPRHLFLALGYKPWFHSFLLSLPAHTFFSVSGILSLPKIFECKSITWAALVAQMVNLLRMRETRYDPCVGKMPWRREWQPTPVFLPEESQASLAGGFSLWGHKKSDTTEQLTLSLSEAFPIFKSPILTQTHSWKL